jgi:molybdopterin-guanine dinucleotide biosynthesis protein A
MAGQAFSERSAIGRPHRPFQRHTAADMTPDPARPPTLGAILAGGRARRLGGGDKTLRTVGGRSVLTRLVNRLAPQVVRLILNANDDPQRFGAFELPIVPDSLPDHPGPLAGVLAALDWTATSDPAIEWVITVPGDAPFLPRDLVTRLHAERQSDNAIFACAASLGRTHPVVALWPVAVRYELRDAVAIHNIRKVDLFTRRYRCTTVEWPAAPADPFFNVNTLADLTEADRLGRAYPEL